MDTGDLPDILDLWPACRDAMRGGDVEGTRGWFFLLDIDPARAGTIVRSLANLRELSVGDTFVPVEHSWDATTETTEFVSGETFVQFQVVIEGCEVLVHLWRVDNSRSIEVQISPWADDLYGRGSIAPTALFLAVHALLRVLIDAATPKRGVFLLEDAQFESWADPAWRDRLVFLDRTNNTYQRVPCRTGDLSLPSPLVSNAPNPTSVPAPHKSAVLEILTIAGPTVATMSSYTIMTFVDKWLVSRLDSDPIYVGAQGNGGLASWVPISLCFGITQMTNTYVSQNMGAGRPERGPAYAWNALWIAIAYWLVVLVPYSFALPWVFTQAEMDPRQAALATTYGEILLWGAGLTMCARAIGHFFYGLHKAWVVMVASIIANIINLFLSAILMFGDGPVPGDLGWFGRICGDIGASLGITPMGIAGSAWGTVIASAFEFALPMLVFLGPRFNRLYQTRSQWRLSLAHCRDLVKLGWPGALMFGNEMVCWGFFMVYLVSHFGPNHATAGWIAHQYMSLSFMPAVGLSVACTALVGKYMGMKRPDLAARRTWQCIALALVYMIACGVCFVVFRHQLIEFFMDSGTPREASTEIIALGSTFLIATAAFQAFDAVAMTTSGALRGAGDTVIPGIVTVILSWGVIVLGGLAAVKFTSWGSLGPWVAAATYIACLGTFLLARFIHGRWRTIDILKKSAGVVAGH